MLTPHPGNLEQLTPEVGRSLMRFWADSATQSVYSNHPYVGGCVRFFVLLLTRPRDARGDDSAKYFFDNMERVCEVGYIPTVDDVVHARIKTTGIKEIGFAHAGTRVRVPWAAEPTVFARLSVSLGRRWRPEIGTAKVDPLVGW